MNTIDRVLAIARDEIGYLEKKNNSFLDDKVLNAGSGNWTKYWRDLKPSFQGQPWCNAYINWCFTQAYGNDVAKQLLCTSNEWSFYTPTSASYFKKKNQWATTPQPGDIIFFKNSERICHVGLVERVEGSTVFTIEGNTSSSKEVVPNGGAVCAKSYNKNNAAIAGYGRPNYEIVQKYKVGWSKDETGWWYSEDGFSFLTNAWRTINRCWYYFNDKGYAVTGYQIIDGERYFFENESGAPKECALMRTNSRGVLEIWYQ